MVTIQAAETLEKSDTDVFWGEMSPCDHFVQIYDEYGALLDGLESFVVDGLQQGDGVIVIATPQHRDALDKRLERHGLPLEGLKERDQYIVLDAEATLARFMHDNWPDEAQFNAVILEAIGKAKANGAKRIRAFGEMVALLWGQGHAAATVRLEHLWTATCQREQFALYCAYPRIGFTKDPQDSMREICAAHTRVYPNVAQAAAD